MKPCRHLVLVLGDHLDEQSPALADFDPATDLVLMAEVRDESTQVWSSKPRTAFFFAAMRHFAAALEQRNIRVDYRRIGTHTFDSLVAVLADAVRHCSPQAIVVVEPGEWRVEQALIGFAKTAGVQLLLREDSHFMCSRQAFSHWAKGYKQLRLEYFYRMMRKRYAIMMDGDDPLHRRWNFDAENRGAFPKAGPNNVPAKPYTRPDAITREAIADVEAHFPGHPGSLDAFGWPVTRKDSLRALKTFVDERLPTFGRYRDAMWTGETQMNCMQHVVGQTLQYGYAHHIQRLMVTGVFGLLAEIAPNEIEDWYLAVYVDAVEWVELPNVAGMALYADAGRFASKPYIASGQYIKRMSNYCAGCRYRPEAKTGPLACPVTTLYWYFLDKHETLLAGNPRTSLMAKNITGMPAADRAALRTHAAVTLRNLDLL